MPPLIRYVPVFMRECIEGTDKDGVEHLLEMAVENLKN
jgi:hypothetical protein